jgi:hypothetical protein
MNAEDGKVVLAVASQAEVNLLSDTPRNCGNLL